MKLVNNLSLTEAIDNSLNTFMTAASDNNFFIFLFHRSTNDEFEHASSFSVRNLVNLDTVSLKLRGEDNRIQFPENRDLTRFSRSSTTLTCVVTPTMKIGT